MPFNFYGLYIPTKSSSNDIEMAEDAHVPGYTKCMDFAEDIETAQCAIMANVVFRVKLDRICGRFPKYKSCNSSHCKNCKYLLLPFKPGKT